MIDFNCPVCQQDLEAPVNVIGCRVECYGCENEFELSEEFLIKTAEAAAKVKSEDRDLDLLSGEISSKEERVRKTGNCPKSKKKSFTVNKTRSRKRRPAKSSSILPIVLTSIVLLMIGGTFFALTSSKNKPIERHAVNTELQQKRAGNTPAIEQMGENPVFTDMQSMEQDQSTEQQAPPAMTAQDTVNTDMLPQKTKNAPTTKKRRGRAKITKKQPKKENISAEQQALFGKPLSPKDAAKVAVKIDELVTRGLIAAKITQNPEIDDYTFLRRAYLDIAGRNPTLKEIHAFVDNSSANKRTELIDRLIYSEAFVSHTFNYWADILRAITNMPRHIHGGNYIDYIKESIRNNKPYDQFVYELLTSEGAAYEDGNGSTGYYLRDETMPLENMSNTMKVFLGTNMTCAQCHDHPYDDWTQADFYKLAAFTNGNEINKVQPQQSEKYSALTFLRRNTRDNPKLSGALVTAAYDYKIGVAYSGPGQIKLPYDYMSDDSEYQANEQLSAEVPFAARLLSKIRKASPKSSSPLKAPPTARDDFAKWLTSKENPMFTKTIVNRLWLRVMKTPLIGPPTELEIDDMGINPQLTALLIKLMKKLNYDTKQFLSILYRTRAYQSEVSRRDLKPREKYFFQGPLLTRLSAEQLWDSYVSLYHEDPEQGINQPKLIAAKLIYNKIHSNSIEDVIKYFKAYSKSNAKKIHQAMLEEKAKTFKLDPRRTRPGMRRASEGIPVKVDLFLGKFGASLRKQIEAASTDATIPQALDMLNGDQIESYLMSNRHSAFKDLLRSHISDEEKIDSIFLAILCRPPSPSEKSKMLQHFSKFPGQAKADLVWLLINSHEFKFNK